MGADYEGGLTLGRRLDEDPIGPERRPPVYVNLDLGDELTAYQLGHADARLVRDLYGHGRTDALERLKRGAGANVVPIRATSLPHAAGETA